MPALTWSTTIWPVLQIGAKPVFVDCDPRTLQMEPKAIEAAITPRTSAIVVVHVLGGAVDAAAIAAIADREQALAVRGYLRSRSASNGTARRSARSANWRSFSFYFSHHITTIEGGMVVTDDARAGRSAACDARARLGARHGRRSEIEAQYADIDPRFLFVTTGFNLRPMEINAAIGLEQLKRLDGFNEKRRAVAQRLDRGAGGARPVRRSLADPARSAGAPGAVRLHGACAGPARPATGCSNTSKSPGSRRGR